MAHLNQFEGQKKHHPTERCIKKKRQDIRTAESTRAEKEQRYERLLRARFDDDERHEADDASQRHDDHLRASMRRRLDQTPRNRAEPRNHKKSAEPVERTLPFAPNRGHVPEN